MSSWIRILFLLVAPALVLSACSPSPGRSADEKEPHFVLGQSRVNAMDYPGAVEAFEESIEVNPRSSAAHFELGWLYEQKVPDPAAAIYHFERYLKLNPNADNAALIKQHIEACRQQLAADVLALPSASATQQQLEKLIEQNRQLQDQLNRWQVYAAQLARTNPTPTSLPPNPTGSSGGSQTPSSSGNTSRPAPTAAKTHAVASGETAARISLKYNVKLAALQAANPNVNLSRLRVGQVLTIPAQ